MKLQMRQWIPRTVAQELTPMLSWFPVVSVTGPRQSGKSTLIKNMLSGSQNFLMEKRIRPISGGARGHASTAAPLV